MFEPLALRLLKQAALFLTQLGSHRPSRNGLTQREDVGSSPRMGSHWSQILIPSNSGLLSSALKSLAGSSAQKKASSLWLAGCNISREMHKAASDAWLPEGTPACRGKKRVPQSRFSLWRLFLSPFLYIYIEREIYRYTYTYKIRYELALNVVRIKMNISALVTMCLGSWSFWHLRGFPGGVDGKKKKIYLQWRRPEFNPWLRKIPWRRKWQHTPIFLPGESHGQRSLAGYSPWSPKELDMSDRLTQGHGPHH